MSPKAIFAVFPGNRAAKSVTALLMGTVLVGCAAPGSGPGVSRYEPTYLNLTEERAFATALRQRYLELATNAFDRQDPARSDFYSLRSIMAAEGKLANPGQPAGRGDTSAEARQAGDRLASLLSTGARTGSPDLAARAQAAYDCWLVEMGSTGSASIAEACRINALSALRMLEGAATGAARASQPASGVSAAQFGATASPASTYTIEPGAGSRTISAPGGYTIEVVTTAAPAVAAAPVATAARYSTVETFAPSTSSYASIGSVSTAMPIMASPSIDTRPILSSPDYEIVEFDTGEAGFDTMPLMMEEQVAMLEPMTTMAPPMMIESTIDSMPATYDLPAIDTSPIFGTAGSDPMPMVEMAALPVMSEDSVVSALMDAATSGNQAQSVFFGFDSADLTLEAEDVLTEAIASIEASGASRVTLMGYTDSVGDARYNQLLAMRRAQAVRKYVQENLTTDVSFQILPVGEVEAVRNGGDGVQEALNRKVEIRVQ